MLQKSRGIVLNQIKYTDSGIVAQMFTRNFGRQSFLIRGMRSRRSGKHNVLFQPMFILDLEMYYRDNRSMQTLKEFSVSFSPSGIYSDVKKSCMAIFLGEIMTSVLIEENSYPELFDFIENSIIWFDDCKTGYSNFHIAFLTGLASFLGFEPGKRSNPDDIFFDLINGKFLPVPPVHGNYADEATSEILSEFFTTSYDQMNTIALRGLQRNDVLETLIRYYSVHLPGLRKVNSLEVLKEIFS